VIARERRQEIMRLLQVRGSVRVSELSQQLGVSDVTIRSDLAALERQSLLQRIHGGAIRPPNGGRRTSFQDRLGRNGRLKRWIGMRAAALVDHGDRIFIDSSTTAFAMLSGLQGRKRLTIVTNGIEVARCASENPNSRVSLVGGDLRSGKSSLVGSASEAAVSSMRFDKVFVSGSGFTDDDGLLEQSRDEAAVKRAAVAAADEVIALVDSSKLASAFGVHSFASLGDVDRFLVDETVAPEHVERLLASGVSLTLCGDGRAALLGSSSSGREHRRIGFANLTEDHPFPLAVRMGLEQAVAEIEGVDLFVADNQMSGPTALKHVDYFVANEVDVVIEYQYYSDYGAVLMTGYRDANIPVIAVDIPMPGATYFGVDNYVAGKMAGDAAAQAATERWGGSVDRVLSLELGAAGPNSRDRAQGQLDALKARVPFTDEQVTHIDSGISRSDTQVAVAERLQAFPDQTRIVVLAGTDEVALGAVDAIKQAGRTDFAIVVSQGADAEARAELLTPGSLLVASVSYVPERYGPQLVDLALSLINNEPVPPAVYISHELVTAGSIREGSHDWLDLVWSDDSSDIGPEEQPLGQLERRSTAETATSHH
jgi:ribose transport system substrate-binding protein